LRGIVFTLLVEMLEEQQGLAFLNSVLAEADLPSGGAYTSGGNYELSELSEILNCLERRLDIPVEFLLRNYGEYMLPRLALMFPNFFEVENLKTFLLSIDRRIHVELKKLYPNSSLPSFNYQDTGEKGLTIYYRSSKKLCFLAEGLIEGAAKHFNSECSLIHSTCMHRGDANCTFELEFYDRSE